MDMLELQYKLQELFQPAAIYPTGSRFYKTEHEGSDYDFLILNLREPLQSFTDAGFTNCSTGAVDEQLVIMRNANNVNLIITNDDNVYTAWKKATLQCRVRRANKAEAKRIHQEVVDHLLTNPNYDIASTTILTY